MTADKTPLIQRLDTWLQSRRKPRTRLPYEAIEQLRALVAAYRRLQKNSGDPIPGTDGQIDKIEERLNQNPAALWWTDLVAAELCLIERLDENQLRARIPGWRRRLREVVGEPRFTSYLASAPDFTKADAAVLRADLSECMRAVYYFYSLYGLSARSRSEVTLSTFQTAVILILVEAILVVVIQRPLPHGAPWSGIAGIDANRLTYLLLTSMAAIVGSVFSVQRRLQDPSVETDPIYRYIQTREDRVSIAVISPLIGAISGLVIFALIASGYLAAPAIKFDKDPLEFGSFALLLVMGFIAGFAEQLVPDSLTRIAAQALTSRPPSPPGSGGAGVSASGGGGSGGGASGSTMTGAAGAGAAASGSSGAAAGAAGAAGSGVSDTGPGGSASPGASGSGSGATPATGGGTSNGH